MHEDAGEIELDLESNVNVGSIDRWRPPKCEATVGDLVQTGPLRVGELLEFHTLFETGRLLPEQTLPGREVGSLEQGVLQNSFHPAQRLDHVRPVVVQVPKFSVVLSVGPPEGVMPEHLVSLELGAHSPPAVVREGVAVLRRAKKVGSEFSGLV